jgi:hypothetical protein
VRRGSWMVALAALAALAVLVAAPGVLMAQRPDDAVLAVVNRMFEGMRTADSGMVRSAFADQARFASVDARSTPPAVRYDSVDGWIAAIATSNRRWDEQIYDVKVSVDDGIAHVWAPYTFYLDRAVRHCGVNTIELVKVGLDWKITQISDSRRREGCPDPLKK